MQVRYILYGSGTEDLKFGRIYAQGMGMAGRKTFKPDDKASQIAKGVYSFMEE